jgi:hypothetical protein
MTRARHQVIEVNTASSSNWSSKVTRESHTLDLEKGVFTRKDTRKIALSLKHSSDISTRRKSDPFSLAMSMLVFYINRAAKKLPEDQKDILQQARDELRKLYRKV